MCPQNHAWELDFAQLTGRHPCGPRILLLRLLQTRHEEGREAWAGTWKMDVFEDVSLGNGCFSGKLMDIDGN